MNKIIGVIVAVTTGIAAFLWCASLVDGQRQIIERQDQSKDRGTSIIDKVNRLNSRLDEWERVDAMRKNQ